MRVLAELNTGFNLCVFEFGFDTAHYVCCKFNHASCKANTAPSATLDAASTCCKAAGAVHVTGDEIESLCSAPGHAQLGAAQHQVQSLTPEPASVALLSAPMP